MQATDRTSHHVRATSESALLRGAARGDQTCSEELVVRHAGPMRHFLAAAGVDDPLTAEEHVARSARDHGEDPTPVRAAWLRRLGAPSETSGDDAFLIARFGELGEAGALALWHAEVEGEDPATLARLLGTDDQGVVAFVRNARTGLLARVVEHTPAGDESGCVELATLLCSGADGEGAAELAAEHGRTCDACMPLVRRAIVAATGLRAPLLRAVAGHLADDYDAVRPAPFRPGSSHVVRAVTTTAGIGGAAAAAAAVAVMVVGPSAVAPSAVEGSSPEAEAGAATPGSLLARPEVVASRGDGRPPLALRPAASDPAASDSAAADSAASSAGAVGGSGAAGQPGTDDPGSGSPGSGGTSSGGNPSQGSDAGGSGGGGSGGSSGGGSSTVTVGPAQVDTSGDGPLVEVDGPVPVQVPHPLPDDAASAPTQPSGGAGVRDGSGVRGGSGDTGGSSVTSPLSSRGPTPGGRR